MRLGDIAEIRTGLVLTRKKATIQYNIQAKYRLLTLKNIDESGTFNNESFDEFLSNDLLEKHYFTEIGDVLIRLSQPNTAVFVDEQYYGLLVPSSFAIIKVNQLMCMPEYLAWYLNSDEVKKEFERSQAGTRIPTTNKNVLETLQISLATLEKQEAIMELFKLHQKEKALYIKLIQEKEHWFKALSKKITEGLY
ncbi:restriction endonuclease subunit S [Brevibacillus formosus]|uniref:restriction endonuclease subunit S n=1 Tax=Brevibacillus formosus TaxID=54913 RepID=UPI003F1B30F5